VYIITSTGEFHIFSLLNVVAERALRFANYVCQRTDRPTPGGGTAILVRKGIDHYAVPVSGLQYPEATAIHLVLATRPVKLVSAYLAPTRPLIESDLTECQSGGIPVVMAGDLNAKHKDWNCRLTSARRSLMHDYADRNSCLIYGPDPQPRLLTRTTPHPTSFI
jgi:hypothetical protein